MAFTRAFIGDNEKSKKNESHEEIAWVTLEVLELSNFPNVSI